MGQLKKADRPARGTEPIGAQSETALETLGLGGNRATKSDLIERAFRISPAQGAGLVVSALALSWAATYLLGGAGRVPPHWFYIPILLAAARFGVVGTVVTALVAGLLAGPLVPLDVAGGTAQPTSDWTGRMGFFIGIGVIMAAIIGRLKTALGRELGLAEAERKLARHKDEVIHTVSHEFRTPLTAILGTADFLGEPGVVADSARPLIDGLERATRRLESLINVVLAAADRLIDHRPEREEFASLRLLCERAAAAAATPEGQRVRFQATSEANLVRCDPTLLTFVLQAVIDNALKFSDPTTPVDIVADRRDGVVEIFVRDRGPGMSDVECRHAFEPFSQNDASASRQTQGVGLGLFAARKTIDLIGGTLHLRPAEQGLEAMITIPSPARP